MGNCYLLNKKSYQINIKEMKRVLIDFFNLCFPPDNENELPRNYELILFYAILFILIILGFFLLR